MGFHPLIRPTGYPGVWLIHVPLELGVGHCESLYDGNVALLAGLLFGYSPVRQQYVSG